MKKLILLFILLSPIIVSAQQKIEEIIYNKKYVLEAFRVSDTKGNSRNCSPAYSFISVDSPAVVIQWINTGLSEYGTYRDSNGMGGVTREGKIYEYVVDRKEKKKGISYIVKMRCDIINTGTYEIIITISNTGNANANINIISASSGQAIGIRLYGKIVPLNEANISIGTSNSSY